VGQGGPKDRLAEADAAARVRGPASQVGGRANLLVDLSESQNRRMSKDYERLCASAEAFVYAAMIRLMVSRLARA
jgi:hypothetical protein